MSRVVVLGAGVVGQVYAGLLADAGHDVCLVARGARAQQRQSAGVALTCDGDARRPACHVATWLADAGPADVVIVAVRGEQLPAVHDEVAECSAPIVVCMANPLGDRASFRARVGTDRTVYAFSGIGGMITPDDVVRFHVVRQQLTVVDTEAPAGATVKNLLATTGLPLHAETHMSAWLDAHSVFIAGIGSAVLAGGHGPESIARSPRRARELVTAMTEGFRALRGRGTPVRPASLGIIFGRVPTWFAARYWQRQFDAPTVRVSIEPHVLATRSTEFPGIVEHALRLVGDNAPRYRRLLEPSTGSGVRREQFHESESS